MDEAQALADRVAVIEAGGSSPRALPTPRRPAEAAERVIRFASRPAIRHRRAARWPGRGAGRRPVEPPRPAIRRGACTTLTGWALDSGDRPRGADGRSAEPRGRLPGADREEDEAVSRRRRAGRCTSSATSRRASGATRPAPGFHGHVPGPLPAPVLVAVRRPADQRPRDRRRDLLRARDHHPRGRLGDARQRGDADGRDARERPPEADAGNAAADLGLHRRPDLQRRSSSRC